MKLTSQDTKPNDTNLEAWIIEAVRKQQIIRTVLVNDSTGEAMEIRGINPVFLTSLFKTGIAVDSDGAIK